MISSCNDAYKQLFGSCDAKPGAPYKYYYPKPENVPPGQTGDGPKPEPEAQKEQIFIAGYEKTSRGVNMAFVTADGEPFYPKSYAVKNLGDCTALVRIDKKILDLTCMPDSMAHAQPELSKDNGTGLLGGKAPWWSAVTQGQCNWLKRSFRSRHFEMLLSLQLFSFQAPQQTD